MDLNHGSWPVHLRWLCLLKLDAFSTCTAMSARISGVLRVRGRVQVSIRFINKLEVGNVAIAKEAMPGIDLKYHLEACVSSRYVAPCSWQRGPMKLTAVAKCAFIASLFLFATSAGAQRSSRFAVFAGYSSQADVTFAPVSSIPISLPSVSLNGWNGSLEFKPIRFLGVVADLSGHYGTYGATIGCEAIIVCLPLGLSVDSSMYSFLVGPQVSVTFWRLTPFAHVLLGGARINQKPVIALVSGLATSDTSFADAIGGGIDIRIVSIVGWRFQADLIQTRFFAAPNPVSFLTSTQSNFRGSTGIVVRF